MSSWSAEEEESEKTSWWAAVSGSAASVRDTILPASLRRRISNAASKVKSYTGTGLVYAGKTAWVLSTAALVLVIPLAMEVDREQALVEMEQQAFR
mgnify:CR=1 FL=1